MVKCPQFLKIAWKTVEIFKANAVNFEYTYGAEGTLLPHVSAQS